MQKCFAVNVSLNAGRFFTAYPAFFLLSPSPCLPHSLSLSLSMSLSLSHSLSLQHSHYFEIYATNKSLVPREVGVGLSRTNISVICNLAFPKSGNYDHALLGVSTLWWVLLPHHISPSPLSLYSLLKLLLFLSLSHSTLSLSLRPSFSLLLPLFLTLSPSLFSVFHCGGGGSRRISQLPPPGPCDLPSPPFLFCSFISSFPPSHSPPSSLVLSWGRACVAGRKLNHKAWLMNRMGKESGGPADGPPERTPGPPEAPGSNSRQSPCKGHASWGSLQGLSGFQAMWLEFPLPLGFFVVVFLWLNSPLFPLENLAFLLFCFSFCLSVCLSPSSSAHEHAHTP